MNRIDICLKKCAQEKVKALIPYIMGGDPDFVTSLAIMHSMVASGADIIELGYAFSDPMADGPVIASSHERALASGMDLSTTLELVRQFRQQNNYTPIVLMGYINPIIAMGYKQFVVSAAKAGVDGVLVVDLPVEVGDDLKDMLMEYNLCLIYFLTPTTNDDRMKKIISLARGYIYYIALKGVTGATNLDVNLLAGQLNKIKELTSMPVAVGFGINNTATAIKVKNIADAIIIGTVIVECISKYCVSDAELSKLSSLVKSFKQVLS